MNKPTPAQEASLRKLFDGNHLEREQVISLHSPKMQEQMRRLIQVKGNSDKLISILFGDLSKATGAMKANPSDQFWRRTAIRTLAATLDGLIYSLKQNALVAGPMNEISLTKEEQLFLSEETGKGESGRRPKLPGFRENLKQTFKLFARVHSAECTTDFGHAGFTCLCETYELRHSLMHPKSFMSFCVTDKQKQNAAGGILWLHVEAQNLIESCGTALQNK